MVRRHLVLDIVDRGVLYIHFLIKNSTSLPYPDPHEHKFTYLAQNQSKSVQRNFVNDIYRDFNSKVGDRLRICSENHDKNSNINMNASDLKNSDFTTTSRLIKRESEARANQDIKNCAQCLLTEINFRRRSGKSSCGAASCFMRRVVCVAGLGPDKNRT